MRQDRRDPCPHEANIIMGKGQLDMVKRMFWVCYVVIATMEGNKERVGMEELRDGYCAERGIHW